MRASQLVWKSVGKGMEVWENYGVSVGKCAKVWESV